MGIGEILEDDDVPVGDRPDYFRHLPSNDQNGPELWERAGTFVSLNDGTICLGLQDETIVLALQSCYGRLENEVQPVVLDNTDILIAKRLWIRHFVITSILYRRHAHQTSRADNFILFDTGIYTDRRNCWFVGEVQMYFSHVQDGQESFFAVVDVMAHHSIDNYGIPKVKKDPRRKHIVVVHFRNIIRCVGLMRFSENEDEFHVVWKYAKFDDMLDKRPPGALNDLRDM